jgi:DNA-nicking Smr family endonuclease
VTIAKGMRKPGKASRFAGRAPKEGEIVERAPTLGELVGPVRPLAPAPKRVPPAAPKRVPRAPSMHASPAYAGQPAPSFAVEDDGSSIKGAREEQKAALRDLALGRLPVVAELDLHGLTAAEAERKLHLFCDRQRRSRRCVVLVVHGRGTHSAGGRGVLRDQIGAWLSHPPLAHLVLCFTTARQRDGGAGATYVLLAALDR